jgi:Carbohydrate esterase, sialic acid-specific acetylesterase
MITRRTFLAITAASSSAMAQTVKPERPRVIATPPPTGPGLVAADITKLAPETEQLDLYLLIGQSNMKGRGVMPETAANNPRILAMHMKDDLWYVARHPLHLTGDAQTFAGHDNAGVGPGLAFAEALAAAHPNSTLGLIPCAVGGSQIKLWQRGAKLYDEAMRRAKLALQTTAPVKGRIRAALWLQGESDAAPALRAVYEAKLLALVDDLRSDLAMPELPFIACTIGEMGDASKMADKAAMNQILLSLPQKRPHTACIDCRDLKTHIGDSVHFDTAAQNTIGQRFAESLLKLP